MDDRGARQRARRAYIRAHHPDRGGDPAEFIAGLASFDAPDQPAVRPVVYVRVEQQWPRSMVSVLIGRILRRRRPPRVQ